MRENLPLYLIYTYMPLDQGLYRTERKQGVLAHYYILDFFSEIGEINKESIIKLFEQSSKIDLVNQNFIGPFASLDDVNLFALEICKELLSPCIYILSTVDYNRALESVSHSAEVKNGFKIYGKRLDNPLSSEHKKGFFKRIFRDS